MAGFKSIVTYQEIELGALTILAGANSSGKSSVLQPTLLHKQTLEAQYDPGPLMIDGPNIAFTSSEQFFSKVLGAADARTLRVSFVLTGGERITSTFKRGPRDKVRLDQTVIRGEEGKEVRYRAGLEGEELDGLMPEEVREMLNRSPFRGYRPKVVRDRCFLGVQVSREQDLDTVLSIGNATADLREVLTSLIHVPGLRGQPERNYRISGVGPRFPGPFQAYVASLVASWVEGQPSKMNLLNEYLSRLELTWKAHAERLKETLIEVKVGRTLKSLQGGARDLVGIADVGYGVSQVLPVLVALVAAQPGQLVFLEQPEIHLHPNAQYMLGSVLADTAARGVQLVVETHSSLLLLSLQQSVVVRRLAPGQVRLHWFQRDAEGRTEVSSSVLDKAGGFGDWPGDFDAVAMRYQRSYLDAVQQGLPFES